MIGTTLGHYEIVEKLGHGGMGEVFRAQDTKLKREVALKILPSDLAEDSERLARFQREAESIAALNHPNIVTIFSVEEDEGTHFLTMELVDGKSLDQLIPQEGMALDRIFEIAIPFADALSSAHEKGIIHRDLKPANVMFSDEGRVKVLDFGLAKLAGEAADELSDDQKTEALTREGRVMGTMPYMSPEQVQGKTLDARSDIFSMGVILYELATGKRPFGGATSADLISSILRDNPDSATDVKLELPHHLGRVIRHCMEKNPKRRYQSALDVRNELEDLRKEIESGVVHSESAAIPVTQPSGRPKWALPAAIGVGALLLAVVGYQMLAPGEESEPAVQPAPSATAIGEPAQPSVAVLYFDNLSNDSDLDWLRSGLTDMLVTDLSQSPDLRVLSTDRLYQIVSDLGKLNERSTSFETVSAVAEQANADTVILGSFAKLGDTIRVGYKIQEAASGEILKADSVDAKVQEELFARVDELSRDIRQSLELSEQPTLLADRDLKDVSTSSVEAYRSFVEAEELHFQFKEEEALALYTKAAEIDPTFAMALAKIATTSGNLGRLPESLEYAERAMEHLDRLTEPERAYVEGRYYSDKLETYDKAIKTYAEALGKYPHLTSLSNNLGILYNELGLLDEAIATQEQGIQYGDTFPGTISDLADAYVRKGDSESAYQVLDDYLQRFPEAFSILTTRAAFLTDEGRLDEAAATVAEIEALRPSYFPLLFSQFSLAVLRQDWEAIEEVAQRAGQIPAPFAKSFELALRMQGQLWQGRLGDMPAVADEAIASYPAPGPARAAAYKNWAFPLLASGHPQKAAEFARAARQEAPGYDDDYEAHGIEAMAQQALGQERRADLVIEELSERVEQIPGPYWKGLAHEVRGRVALERGGTATAVAELEKAEQAVPEQSGNQVRVWFFLGRAYLEAGRPADAQDRFERVVTSHGDHVFQPMNFVRSLYYLAQIHEQQGDSDKARDSYQRFLDYWGEGNLDPDRIAAARDSVK